MGLLGYHRAGRKFLGFVVAILIIVLQGNLIRDQSNVLYQAGPDIIIKGRADSFFRQTRYAHEGFALIYEVNGQSLGTLFQPRVRLTTPILLQPNDLFEFSATVKPVIGRLNEIGFDAEAHYMAQSVIARVSVKANTPYTISPQEDVRSSLQQKLVTLTQNSPFQGIILALTFGERNGIDEQEWRALRNSGLIHLVAISGLHIGIAFSVGYFLGLGMMRLHAKLLWSPFVCGALLAVFYAWLAGFTLPTQRALIMCLLNVALVMLAFPLSALKRILLTLVAVLVWSPFTSLSNSFWMSFLAVAIVLYQLASQSQRQVWWKALLWAQVFLVCLMAPVTAYFFGGLSVTAVLYNLVFIPWFSLVIVPALFLGLLLMVVWPGVATAYWPWVDWTFLPLDWALQFADVGWWVVPSKVQGVVAASVAILLLYRFMSLKACSLLLGMIGLWWWFPSLTPLWRMDVLDVGHGLAIVIEQDERAIVYDTGSSWPGGSYVQSVIEPMLQQRGLRQVDGVILSHLDNDHAGDWQGLAERWQPDWIRASQLGTEFMPCIRGESWQWQSLHFTVLWPPQAVSRAYNPHSCVIRMTDTQSNYSVLLSGDVTAMGEWLLARDGVQLQSDVMIVPHHGSKTSSTAEFIVQVNPKLAIASVAKDNRWNLPNPQVVARYQAQQVEWLDTGHAGQISLFFYPDQLDWFTQRSLGWQPWYRQMLRKGVE
ncbi:MULTISPECIES: DNA internalization-related competence protein ComEC/Rec2 [Vibrio]|uniref:DNA internalization-related competence protein ComEC/Rec2 n=1 Tax=Vibrio TaxID=662 RepID=UPI00050CFA5B|nr:MULTISPECIES: DNA internalization-related competence protein ComEC/Rec2 [Vibrio]MCO7011106.1 DNA internalization-related competence protein ComEC/Rec2 [Vibrio paracholerae]MCO7031724.1 DNA internalization-related competence protein ComEC/Rec2 [Vibrio paracholerae]MCO7044830.1 DNA internalization-related competence protein ComEC/Rec2 [Vibrio paracholerae]MDX5007716.1 DNA internalization-related competence protein ComEC/Rec2 [Vibrio cholerae]